MPRKPLLVPSVLALTVCWWSVFLLVGTAGQGKSAPSLPPPAARVVDYDKDVKPLLAQNCYSCHGGAVQQSGLRLDLRQNALRGGDYGPVILPGKSAESKLIRRLVDGDGGMQMPPSGALAPDEIGVLRAWIDQGADFRTEIVDDPPAKPVDPRLAAAITAARGATAAPLKQLLASSPELITATDAARSTLLHHAAGFGTPETMTWLLDNGALVTAKNAFGSTPLHWAIHDEAKVRVLLARGANVNAKQVEGRTPLSLAASLANGRMVLRLLLDHGADPAAASAIGQAPLMLAASRGDVEAMRLLLDRKVDVNARNSAGETALMFAASDGNPKAIAFLLERGADSRLKSKRNETALGNAGTTGSAESVRLLLGHGADVNVQNIRGYSPLMLAASSDARPVEAVKLLLAKGALTTYTGDYDETARDLAAKRGDTEVARLLGARWTVPSVMAASHVAVPSGTLAKSVEKALALLEKQSHTFIRVAGCNSCHSQDLVSAAAGLARSRGLNAPGEIAQLPPSMTPPAERIMDFAVVNVGSVAWELFDLGMTGAPKTPRTDAVVRYIKALQTAQGHWSANESRRPPMNVGDFQFTALAIYALKHYSPVAEQATTDRAIANAAAWLSKSKPDLTQDRAFRALGLAWAGGDTAVVRSAARSLVAMQREDGGWSQLPTLQSDAYATGQALYALNTAGGMAPSDPVYRKGVAYLMRTQAADGSWHVKSRSIWLQPYFESGFPYGQDQFISAAGTAWASMALTMAVQPTLTTRR